MVFALFMFPRDLFALFGLFRFPGRLFRLFRFMAIAMGNKVSS